MRYKKIWLCLLGYNEPHQYTWCMMCQNLTHQTQRKTEKWEFDVILWWLHSTLSVGIWLSQLFLHSRPVAPVFLGNTQITARSLQWHKYITIQPHHHRLSQPSHNPKHRSNSETTLWLNQIHRPRSSLTSSRWEILLNLTTKWVGSPLDPAAASHRRLRVFPQVWWAYPWPNRMNSSMIAPGLPPWRQLLRSTSYQQAITPPNDE